MKKTFLIAGMMLVCTTAMKAEEYKYETLTK